MLYIIFNPNAARGRAARYESQVREALSRSGLAFKLVRTTRSGEAHSLAAAAAADPRYTAIVAAGGDGTLNEVAGGLCGASTPLGIIPLGTGNDLAKILGLQPNRIDPAIHLLAQGTPRPIDAAVANGRVFVNGLGCGIDAQVTVESLRPTRLRGFAVYLVALARALARYRPPTMRIAYDGGTIEQRTLFAAIGNGRCQGGGFWLTPDAVLDDGRLDLCTCAALRPDQIARYLPKVLRGTHTRLREVRMAHITQVTIEMDAPTPVHVDGELLGTDLRQVDVTIKPDAIRLIQHSAS